MANRTISRRLLPMVGGFSAVALLVFIFNRSDSNKIDSNLNRLANQAEVHSQGGSPNQADTANPKPSSNPDPNRATNSNPPSAIEKFIHSESLKVGRTDSDPDRSFRRLKSVARRLKSMDMATLKRTALNLELNNDQRFLAVYLLSLAESALALPALNEIALAPIKETDTASRLYAEELVVRTQALEGLANVAEGRGLLNDYTFRQDNAFLSDQARRLLREKRGRH